MPTATNVLFGESKLNARKKYQKVDEIGEEYNDNTRWERPEKGTISAFFFGFMYEEATEDLTDDDKLYSSSMEPSANIWNPLNASLCVASALCAAAEVAPVTLIAIMSDHWHETSEEAASFTTRAASAAALGASLGKFMNGPVVDIAGARRTFACYSVLLSLSLLILSMAPNPSTAILACFLVEFTSSVQWPCVVVALAAHYRGNSSGMYEGGVYVTSLGARIGSMLSIQIFSMLLSYAHWRALALFAAWFAIVACSVAYLYVKDTPDQTDYPQNPIDKDYIQRWFPLSTSRQKGERPSFFTRLSRLVGILRYVVRINILPSVKHILASPTFWLVAVAHSGASTVRSSERILGAYFYDTSSDLTEQETSGSALFLSAGIVAGLMTAGNAFAGRGDRERKRLVSRLYMVSIFSCYMLSFFAIPYIQRLSPDLMQIFQKMAVIAAGFGISVPLYHIPSIVGATFGCDKGLFAAYTDGVGYGLSSLVWGLVVGDSVQHHHGSGTGWAYGWAAVALLLVLTAVLMVEFMEHYFCRHRNTGTYETIIFA